MELHEWLTHYLKRRDLDQSIRRFEKLSFFLIADHGDRKDSYFVKSKLEEGDASEILAGKINRVCTENTEENFSFLLRHWKEFAKIPGLMFIFVNLGLGERWVIYPHSHSFIADEETLEAGLRTMFDTANGKVAEIKQEKGRKPKLFEESEEDEEE